MEDLLFHILISEEGIESAELHPPTGQLLGTVSRKAARIRADHGDLEHLEHQDALDRVSDGCPGRVVVAEPMYQY